MEKKIKNRHLSILKRFGFETVLRNEKNKIYGTSRVMTDNTLINMVAYGCKRS